MFTKTSMCNYAFLLVKRPESQDVDIDSSPQAISARSIFDATYTSALMEIRPVFARRRAILAPDASQPDGAYDYKYAYSLPADYLIMVHEDTDDDKFYSTRNAYYTINKPLWVIEGSKILTNSNSPLHINYVYNFPANNVPDATFALAVSYKLAIPLSQIFMQDIKTTQVLIAQEALYTNKSKIVNAAMKAATAVSSTPWVLARQD